MVHLGTLRNTWVRSGTLGYAPVHLGTLQYTWVRSGTLQYTWVRSGTLGYAPVHLGTLRYTPLRSVTLWYTWVNSGTEERRNIWILREFYQKMSKIILKYLYLQVRRNAGTVDTDPSFSNDFVKFFQSF